MICRGAKKEKEKYLKFIKIRENPFPSWTYKRGQFVRPHLKTKNKYNNNITKKKKIISRSFRHSTHHFYTMSRNMKLVYEIKSFLPERLLFSGIVCVPLQRLLSCDSILHKNKVASLNGFDNSCLYLWRTSQYDSYITCITTTIKIFISNLYVQLYKSYLI